jgi:membrane protease YdiL (CAAX protease family)
MSTATGDFTRPASRPFALLLYFMGAYAWTWSFNLMKVLSQRDIVSAPMPFIVLDIAAGLGPLVAALAVTSYEAGAAGRRALLEQLLRWRVPMVWYVVAILGPVVLAAVTFGTWLATGGSPPPAEALAQWTLLPVYFVYIVLVGGGLDEELGWRGYALPRLQQRYSALIASVIVGVFWAGWHVPAWFMRGSGQDVVSFPVFAVSTTAAAIVFAWLYNSTGGSLPLVILAHTVFDLCTTGPWFRALFTLPPDQRGLDPFNILTVVVLAVAVGVAFVTDRRTLTMRPADAMSPNSRGPRAAGE